MGTRTNPASISSAPAGVGVGDSRPSHGWNIGVAGLIEFRFNVRAADSALLQIATGFWPPFLFAFALRLYGFFRFPFLDEEDRMVRSAVNSLFGYGPQGGQAPFWENLLFRVPLTNSQGITPLWWWANYLARLLLGQEELSARLTALIFGLIGLALFFSLCRRLFQSPIPALLAWLLAVHDVFLWTGTKAQYPETILFTMAVVMAWALLVERGAWRWFVAAAAASVAAMGYFLLKGITLTATALAVGGAQVLLGRRLDVKRAVLGTLCAGAMILPLVAWLVAAQGYIAAHYQVRVGELGYFQSIPDILRALTLDYGTGRTASLIGPWYYAFVVYSQGDAWPISTAQFLPMAVGWGLALLTVSWAVFHKSRDRAADALSTNLALYIALGIGLTLAPVVLKGSFGERYHVLYLVASMLAVGVTLERLWRGGNGSWGIVIALAGLWLGIGLAWADWVRGVLDPGWPMIAAAGAGIALGAIYGLSRHVAVRRAVVVGAVGAIVLLTAFRGPLHWGQFAAFGPEPNSWILNQIQQQYHP